MSQKDQNKNAHRRNAVPDERFDTVSVPGTLKRQQRLQRPLGGKAKGQLVLGKRIKTARSAKGWTLQEASNRTGVARSTLSKIENGIMSPTYDILYKIVVGMNLDLVELFDTRRQLAPQGRRSITWMRGGKILETNTYVHELAATDLAHKKMLPFKTRIKARRFEDFGGWIQHEGEEFLLVLSGEVQLLTEYYSPAVLSAGDSVYFDSKMGHALISLGHEDAEVIWVCTGLPED